ncbi:MAG TPA: MFS transporter [Candidatus Saccharimonadia bacterium]|nr:MFS transporter [Candidatus Saccharimonadia bacterium]
MKEKTTNHWLILVILALAQFMVVLDISIVNVMLPTVQKAFHLSQLNLQWIITAYTLAFGGFLLLGGRAADLFGRRKVFLTGVTIFTLASLADGLSQSGGMLIGIRLVQGLSAAFMSPAALSIVLVTYKEGHERNLALSVWGAVAAGGAAVGVLLGGIVTQYLGWRWNFFINVPVGIFVVASAWKLVPKHENEERSTSLDLAGAVSVTAGLISLVYGLTNAPTKGWTSHSSLLYFGLSIVLLIFFVFNEKRAKHPLMPLSIFKIRNVSGANLIQLSIAASLFSVFFFTTLYVQEILGYSQVKTGVSFLVLPVVIAICATNAPRLIQKVGYKPILVIAPLFTAAGLLWLAHVPVHGHYGTNLVPGFILMAIGLGFSFVSILVAATTGVAGHLSGLASGLVNTSQQVGGSIGLALISGIAASSTVKYLHHSAVQGQLVLITARVHGFQTGYYAAAGFALFASLLAIVVIKQKKSPDGSVPSSEANVAL